VSAECPALTIIEVMMTNGPTEGLMTIKRTTLAMVAVASILGACGGGGSADTGNNSGTGGNGGGNVIPPPPPPPPPPPAPTPELGVFIDSAVAGIHYTTATQSGETDAEGRFKYLPGETVTFSIGGITLPPAEASDILTPLMVFDTNDFTDPRVVNLGRLLQSLDDDGDLDNGIQITAEARTAATGLTLDFAVPAATFEANADVTNLLSNGGGSATLVPVEDAVAHMQDQAALNGVSLVGSWYISEDGETILATFFSDGKYMLSENAEEDDTGESGAEYGTYVWDPVTGELTTETLSDTNGEWGLSHPQGAYKVVRDGDTLTFTETNDATVGDEAIFNRVVSTTEDSIVGTWVVDGQSEGTVSVFVFLADGHFMLSESGTADDAGGPGIELGTYTWDAGTSGFFIGEMLKDTNGEWGISHDEPLTVEVDGNTLSATFAEGEVVTMTRVK
jgi:hypothetical protein